MSGELGYMKDTEIKLDVNIVSSHIYTSVRPTRQPQIPIAFHLRKSVEQDLLKQID